MKHISTGFKGCVGKKMIFKRYKLVTYVSPGQIYADNKCGECKMNRMIDIWIERGRRKRESVGVYRSSITDTLVHRVDS